MEDLDYDKLKADLIYLYSHAMNAYPVAIVDIIRVEEASEDELVRIARMRKFDLSKYKRDIINNKDIKKKEE